MTKNSKDTNQPDEIVDLDRREVISYLGFAFAAPVLLTLSDSSFAASHEDEEVEDDEDR
ncbi:MAG: hypothetical protein HKN34_11700, partial [Gammaproteobacteria bacterium]|nr:hypothetical protein [Gammaproteobacteria bacterium]